jgi:hypothetical protein
VNEGDVITFDWNFFTTDYLPFNDFAFFTADEGVPGNAVVFELSDVAATGRVTNDGGSASTGWVTTFEYTVQQTGVIKIGFGVVDASDFVYDSHLLIDNLQVTSPSANLFSLAAFGEEQPQAEQRLALASPAEISETESELEQLTATSDTKNLTVIQSLAAAAAGLTSLGAQWAHAAQHEWNDKPDFDFSHFDPKGDHEDPSPFGQFGKFERGTNFTHDASKSDVASDSGSPDGHGPGRESLSDIIAQHFAALSDDDPNGGDTHLGSDKPTFSAPDRQEDRGREDDGPRSHAEKSEKSETHHSETPQSETRQAEANHGDGFGPIVDFSSLPLPAHGDGAGAKGLMGNHFKFGDLASMIDFSRDLLPNSVGPAAETHVFEKAGGTHAAAAHHAAPPEPIHHVAAHDIVQNMSNDMDAAAHHAH